MASRKPGTKVTKTIASGFIVKMNDGHNSPTLMRFRNEEHFREWARESDGEENEIEELIESGYTYSMRFDEMTVEHEAFEEDIDWDFCKDEPKPE